MISARVSTHNNAALLGEHKRRIVQSVPQLMKAAGRLIAVSAATSTTPYGVGDGARRAGENAVRRDISRVYASPGKVFSAFPDTNKAAGYWKFMRESQYAKAQTMVDAYCPQYRGVPIGQFDGGEAHQAARRKGRVSKSERAFLIVQSNRNLQAYVKREVDHVGEAKAGWAACANILGSMRGLPQWVTRHAGKLSGGNVQENYSGTVFSVRMQNLVRYASDALSSSEKQVAIRIGLDRFLRGQLGAIMRGNVRTNF